MSLPRFVPLTLAALLAACGSVPNDNGSGVLPPPPAPGPGTGHVTPREDLPSLQVPQFVYQEDDLYHYEELHPTNCPGTPRLALGTPSNPAHHPSVLNGVGYVGIHHAFATDSSGTSTVDVILTCNNGSVTVPAAVTFVAAPDVELSVVDEATGTPPLTAVTILVNGDPVVVQPTGARIQLRNGTNVIERLQGTSGNSLASLTIDGHRLEFSDSVPHALIDLHGADVRGKMTVIEN